MYFAHFTIALLYCTVLYFISAIWNEHFSAFILTESYKKI